MMFDCFEAYDVQETRRVSREEGKLLALLSQVRKKLSKNLTVPEIADVLETPVETIQTMMNCITQHPDLTDEELLAELSMPV